jgi:hypothetical protein
VRQHRALRRPGGARGEQSPPGPPRRSRLLAASPETPPRPTATPPASTPSGPAARAPAAPPSVISATGSASARMWRISRSR